MMYYIYTQTKQTLYQDIALNISLLLYLKTETFVRINDKFILIVKSYSRRLIMIEISIELKKWVLKIWKKNMI